MSQAIVPSSAVPFGAPAITAGGINGLGSLRFVGTTNGGPPTSGTYNTRDVVLDLNTLLLWICTSGGTPGTWTGLSYLRTDSGAPNPQMVQQPVVFQSNANQSSQQPILAKSPDGSYIALAPSVTVGSWNALVQAGDEVLVFVSKGNPTNPSFLSIVPWASKTAGIRIGSDGTVKSANNTLDDGSGGIVAAGAMKAQGAYFVLEALSGGYKIQSGAANISNVSPNTVYTTTITFPVPFSSAPYVYVTSNTNTVNNSYTVYLSAYENTATQFTVEGLISGTANPGTISFSWIAIGN